MGKTEQAIWIANRMFQCRKAAKTLWGSEYKSKVAPYIEAVKSVMKGDKVTEIKAVLKITEMPQVKASEMAVILLMSAAIEISEENIPK